jgi:glycosyltransferase involved in cell wall biosynthesis
LSDALDPLISVVTVVFNGRRFVEETIESVRAQTYPRVEHWFIDGGSTDGTLDIIRGHEAHLAGWISEPDAGIADAFNKGVARARGDYLMFLNADDALARREALAELMAAARDQGWPDVVYGDMDICDPETGERRHRISTEYMRERLVTGTVLPHPSMLMHSRYFRRHGGFDTSYKVGMDLELFLRGIPQTGALHVPVLVSRMRAGGISVRARQWVVDETIRALRSHGYLGATGAARMRCVYALRGLARRVLEGMGLYRGFDAWRRRA